MLDLVALSEEQFQALWRDRIEPLLKDSEGPRIAALAERNRRLMIGLPIAGAVGVAASLFTAEIMPAFIFGGMAAIVAWGVAEGPVQKVARAAKAGALTTIAEAIGVTFSGTGRPSGVVDRFRSLGLLPSCDRENYDDWFHGDRKGCGFDLFEGHMERRHRTKNGETWSTVFRGQILRVSFPRAFSGTTIVQRDAGVFNGLAGLGSSLERVGFADPDFERKFEVRSTDQVEARVLMHPVFVERLLELEQQMRGGRLRCGFQDGDLLIAIESKDRYEIGDMGKTLVDPARARSIIDDLAAVLRVMDAVLTAEQATLLRHNQARNGEGA